MAKVSVTMRAYNEDGYHKDILVMDENQVIISDTRVKQGNRGPKIFPLDFGEMEFFEVIVKELGS